MIKKTVPKLYQKHQSFLNFYTSKSYSNLLHQQERAIKAINEVIDDKTLSVKKNSVLRSVLTDLLHESSENQPIDFKITPFIAEEMEKLDTSQVIPYLYHRYRYDVNPKKYLIDDFPPYVQIEPTSICNFRCIFCYQTDKTFSKKSSGFMGTMTLETFKCIVNQIENRVEFVSLASRGEPLICREIDQMLEYSVGKFLNLKVNTNASLLTEKHSHAILSGGVKTLVFSADAAEEPLYSQLRVRGNLNTTIKNIEMFQSIKAKCYPHSKLITRVSGVQVNKDEQDMKSMVHFWGRLVDQVSFVKYNPWENTYSASINKVKNPCSDLWRRAFIWHDGLVNPCDNDYKSTLAIGNIHENTIEELWNSPKYSNLRKLHKESKRRLLEPCCRCLTI